MDFNTELKRDDKIKRLTEQVRKTGDMKALNRLGTLVGEKMLERIGEELKDSLIDEKYVRSVVSPILKIGHEYMTEISAAVIDRLYSDSGVGLKAITADYDTAKEDEIIEELLSGEVDDGNGNS